MHLIIEVLKKVTVKVQWTHFGGGELAINLLEQSKQLPDNIHVNFMGHKQNHEVLSFYKTTPIHLFVHFSETEGGVPVSLQEAASFGIPLLGTNIGGIPEIVTEKTGVLIPVDFNIQEVAQFINEFRSSFRNTQEFRMECKEFWRTTFEANNNYERFYLQLMETIHES